MSPGRVIDGRAVAARVREAVATRVTERGRAGAPPPGLATILVGEDPASDVYVSGKQRACAEVGITGFDHRLGAAASREEVAALIGELNHDDRVHGILLQLPVPPSLDGPSLTALIAPDKDVDGLTPVSAGRLALGHPGLRPCTPLGVMELLASERVQLEGAEAVVLGRSNLFGKPMHQLLLGADATVTTCHSRTRDLDRVCRRAEILIAAVGRPQMVKGDWVREGAVVIDVGINRLEGGLVGDVDFDAAVQRAAAITPVPGGVGPMTIACLLRNTVLAAEHAGG